MEMTEQGKEAVDAFETNASTGGVVSVGSGSHVDAFVSNASGGQDQNVKRKLHPLMVALQSVRANLVPMLILWACAASLVAVYYRVPGGAELFGPIKSWQTTGGWWAAFINRVIFLALLPGAFMACVPSIRPPRLGLTVLAYALWGGAWGVFDDWFYPLLAQWFGEGTDFATLALKTVAGQLIGTIIVGLVPGTLFFRWVAADFSIRRMRADWPKRFFGGACLSLLLANWIVWIPVNICTYAFPVPLQIQLVGLAGCFWMLVGLETGRRNARKYL